MLSPIYALFFSSTSFREHQVSPVMELAYYCSYSYCDGPLAYVNKQCFSDWTHLMSKTRKLLSQLFMLHAHNHLIGLSYQQKVHFQCRYFTSKHLSANANEMPLLLCAPKLNIKPKPNPNPNLKSIITKIWKPNLNPQTALWRSVKKTGLEMHSLTLMLYNPYGFSQRQR